MKYLFIGTGIIAAVVFAALTWGPLGKGTYPASPPARRCNGLRHQYTSRRRRYRSRRQMCSSRPRG